ncbi:MULTISPECIES: hypothetical protein [Frankia]|uniref:hypothetical protein n=1 Tax=Frankia TaxID=1854 RepID=UPI0012FFC414|nr:MULTISPECIES: hypothetical protein [Frankia]
MAITVSSAIPSMAIPVAPPALSPPALSLLRAAVTADPEDDKVAASWPRGFAFLPYGATQPESIDVCDRTTANSLYPGGGGAEVVLPARVDYVPFVVSHQEPRSTFGLDAAQWQDRALRSLVAGTSSAVEYELWTGTIAQAKGYPQRWLAMPVIADGGPVVDLTPAGGPVAPLRALGLLEQALANAGAAAPSGAQDAVNVSTGQPIGPGRRGMIHCLPEMLPLWQANGLIRREGKYLLTLMDSIVVPGSGYPGTGPGGSTPNVGAAWLYATSMIHIRLEDPYIVDGEWLADLDRSVNTVAVTAQRAAAAYWDYSVHFAVQTDLEV